MSDFQRSRAVRIPYKPEFFFQAFFSQLHKLRITAMIFLQISKVLVCTSLMLNAFYKPYYQSLDGGYNFIVVSKAERGKDLHS